MPSSPYGQPFPMVERDVSRVACSLPCAAQRVTYAKSKSYAVMKEDGTFGKEMRKQRAGGACSWCLRQVSRCGLPHSSDANLSHRRWAGECTCDRGCSSGDGDGQWGDGRG